MTKHIWTAEMVRRDYELGRRILKEDEMERPACCRAWTTQVLGDLTAPAIEYSVDYLGWVLPGCEVNELVPISFCPWCGTNLEKPTEEKPSIFHKDAVVYVSPWFDARMATTEKIWKMKFDLAEKLHGQNRPDDSHDDPDHHNEDDLATRYFGDLRL